jgi:hypothetical protein
VRVAQVHQRIAVKNGAMLGQPLIRCRACVFVQCVLFTFWTEACRNLSSSAARRRPSIATHMLQDFIAGLAPQQVGKIRLLTQRQHD